MTSPTIPIQALSSAPNCGSCHSHDTGGPACRPAGMPPCLAPSLSGPPEQLQQVLASLAQALIPPGPGDASEPAPVHSLVRALRLGDGEAELQLDITRHGCGMQLADTAFQTLRQVLPDTDIYVRFAD